MPKIEQSIYCRIEVSESTGYYCSFNLVKLDNGQVFGLDSSGYRGQNITQATALVDSNEPKEGEDFNYYHEHAFEIDQAIYEALKQNLHRRENTQALKCLQTTEQFKLRRNRSTLTKEFESLILKGMI